MFRNHAWMLSGNAVCFLGALTLAACGGDKSADTSQSGSGGALSSGSGGAQSASGSTGAGASAGGASGAGGVPTMAYPCDAKAPPTGDMSATITSTGTWGTSGAFTGGSFVFGDADMNTMNDLTIDYSNFSLHVTGKAATYAGFGLWFAPLMGQTYPCVDAGAFQGVSFNMVDALGTVATMQFSAQTHATAPVDTKNNRGGCLFTDPANRYKTECVYPATTITTPTGGGVVQVPWASFVKGIPDAPVDGKSLDGLQWQFPWADAMTPYDIDVTFKDIKFY